VGITGKRSPFCARFTISPEGVAEEATDQEVEADISVVMTKTIARITMQPLPRCGKPCAPQSDQTFPCRRSRHLVSLQSHTVTRCEKRPLVGADKDSEKRQRAAIEAYAKRAGMTVVDWFYDPAVSGADRIEMRPGFKAMLERIAGNGVRCIIVESPDRFARDLAVQLAGHDYLKGLGISLIPATAPDFFREETPTAVLVRQVLGAISQFEKATIVAKLKAARDRKRAETGRCGGNRPMAETRPELVALAKRLRYTRSGRQRSLREISRELAARDFLTERTGKPFVAAQVASMLKEPGTN
jgi:DNA invertase Pin-like site-specific DNA recombinase